jgi:hypothetical protein
MRAEAGDFEVQTLRKAIKRGSKKIYNVAAGVKVNAEDDRVIYTARTNTLTLNGAPLLLTDGESATEIDGGGTVEKSGTFYTITSEAGDVVRLVDVNKYVNVEIQAGPNRQADELKGYLGQFDTDSDPNNDLVFPEDQIQAASNSQFLHFVLEILTAWQVLLTLSMFA